MFLCLAGLGIDNPVWIPTAFTRNRDRLLATEISRKVMACVGQTVPGLFADPPQPGLAHGEVAPLSSDDPFPADGAPAKAT